MNNLFAGCGQVDSYGTLTSPNHLGIPYNIKNGDPWGGDLGCLDGPNYVKRINFNAVIDWLPKIKQYKDTCIFLAGFDVVGDAQQTLDAYYEFAPYFTDWPLAYVAQDGAENLPIPENCAAVFIGGTTEWKKSYEAVTVIQRAQAMGKHIHIGRVNYWDRYQLFEALPGSEHFTFDGNRQKYEGRERTIEAWNDYAKRTAIRQFELPTSYKWKRASKLEVLPDNPKRRQKLARPVLGEDTRPRLPGL